MNVRELHSQDIVGFLNERTGAVVHFDANLDVGHRPIVRQRMREAARCLDERVNFGEMDIDVNAVFARSLKIVNVPAVTYFKNGELVFTKTGANQDIVGNTRRLLDD